MKNLTKQDFFDIAIQPGEEVCARFHRALGILTGKWKGEILWQLVQRTCRFGELRRAIPGVSRHMLTVQLRELETDGLVRRTVYAETPLRVEYELTDAARALKPVFRELFLWSQQHGPGRASEAIVAGEARERPTRCKHDT